MDSETAPPAPTPAKLLDQVRDKIRVKHYNIRTETQYVQWIRRFILFHGKRHPKEMGAAEAEAFLTHLAVDGNVSASTQNQALSALLFLYREVLEIDLPWLDNVVWAKPPQRLPTGLMECCRLRVKDVDFGQRECANMNKGGRGVVSPLDV